MRSKAQIEAANILADVLAVLTVRGVVEDEVLMLLGLVKDYMNGCPVAEASLSGEKRGHYLERWREITKQVQ